MEPLATITAALVAVDDPPGAGLGEVERVLELVGLFTFAISGAMLGVRRDFEIVGVATLALVTALGGGILRDLLLGDTPPRALVDVWYLAVPLAAAAVVFVAHGPIDRHLHRPVLIFDAAGLGLFCVTGAIKASAYDTTAVGAVLVAVITATGGGILRDVLANDQPQLFQADSRLYAIPAAVGATILVVIARQDGPTDAIAPAVAAGVFVFRLAALRWGWRAPSPLRGRPGGQAARARKLRRRS